MKKLIAEFIGTFFLVLTIGLVVVAPSAGYMAPVAIGSVLMVMVFANGHISGAHFNPAVSLAVWIRGKLPTDQLFPYICAQVLGAGVAAALVLYFKLGTTIVAAKPDVAAALLAEVIFSFALAYVVLNVATAKGTANNSFYGLAIGFTVLVGAYAVGPISGGVFNPAVAVGISIVGISSWQNIWIFLLANFVGGGCAGYLFKGLNPKD